MHAITFETSIVGEFLRIPNFELFQNKHVRVVIEADAVTNDTMETKALSNHSANSVEDWMLASEDEVWK